MRKYYFWLVSSLVVSFVFAVIYTQASTTISTNITTGGTLTVSGAAALSSTLAVTDAATLSSTLTVGADGAGTDVTFYTDTSGNEFLWDASEEQIALDGTNGTTVLDITDGNLQVADTASTTQLIVGGASSGGTISGIAFGYCNIPNTTVAASTTVAAICSSATGVRVNDRIFVQATSSLASRFQVISASSTATAGQIGLYIYNNNWDGGADTTSVRSINFYSLR